MPHLFREDLEEIEEVLKESDSNELRFETNDFEYGSVKEIPEKTKQAKDFHIQIYKPYINLNFSKRSAYVYASEEDIKSIGIAGKIVNIVKKRERKFLYYLKNIFSVTGCIAFSILSFFLIDHIDPSKKIAILFLILLLYSIISFFVFVFPFPSHSLIDFYCINNQENFFFRNKDQIILVIFGAVIGAIVTFIFQKIFS